ncbi:hypothetical protein [Tepidimonas sp. HKU79]|uniref:hypothetical protein n=1 Tax=unclassified Tepidimonas TaxID=2631705 RepID=UPI003C7B96F7
MFTRLAHEVFHDGAGVGQQLVLALGGAGHFQAGQRRGRAGAKGVEPGIQAAPP